jgi:uncharacterized membrane protein
MAETGHKFVDRVDIVQNATLCIEFRYTRFISKVPSGFFALNRTQKR